MADQSKSNAANQSEEIDLGQLIRTVRKGFHNLFQGFLRVFIYLKRRIIILSALAIVGFLIGYGLSKMIDKKQKIEVIVKPNLESKNYLYDVINEIQANIVAEDTTFFRGIGIHLSSLKGYEILIEPASDKEQSTKSEIEYLELLQKFENTGIIADVLRAEILNKSSLNHRIIFLYKDRVNGPKFAEKVVAYINSNKFFDELVATNRENAQSRIGQNSDLVRQIDLIIANYSEKLGKAEPAGTESRIVLDSEEKLNITGLFELKNSLIHDSERKRIELLEQKEAISIINFGQPHQVQKSFFGKKIVLVPTLLLVFYFLVDFIRYLNRKATELGS